MPKQNDRIPGIAKRIGELLGEAYQLEYGWDAVRIVRPSNVYGPYDDFNPNTAQVIPALIHRMVNGENPVHVWGDGSAIRDFAFSRDVAEGIILALYYGTRGDFVNLGSGTDTTIKEPLKKLNSFLDFNYSFDTSKSSGFPKRIMDISRAREWINYNPTTSLLDGLKETWNWFQDNQDEYLKRKNYFAEE